MTVPNIQLKSLRSQRQRVRSTIDFDQRWRRIAAMSTSTTQLRLQECEDRSTPSVAPFYAVASDHFADSLLTSSAAIRNELVIIDPAVPDYQSLLRDLQLNSDGFRRFEFHVLSSARDGLDQVTELLANRSSLDAVHFVTHGYGGGIRLGTTWIDGRTILQRGDQVAAWSSALTPGADFLFYGCDLAGHVAGQQFLQSVRQFTMADVAASTDRTGSALRGGDWDLEYRVGDVETELAFSSTLQKTYTGSLALFVVTSNNDSGTGTLREAITKANTAAGADTISFSFGGSTRIRPSSPLPIITDVLTIDATTMSGYSGTPLLELDGSNTSGTGLQAQARVTIRGLAIYNFSANGIWLNGSGANSSQIQACHIGTDGIGKNDLGNGQFGISVVDAQSIMIGGSTAGSGNLISGNNLGGISFSGPSTSNNRIQGNRIGTDITGLNALANSGQGILLQNGTNNNIIGGTGSGNIIAFNSGDGIRLIGSNTTSNQFFANSIYSNGGLGIDLDGNGPTLNDTNDVDSGANALKNYAVLTLVLTNGTQVTISGTYNGVASTTYRLELYASPTNDPSGYGEGARYLGFVNFTTNSSGNGTFNVVLTAPVAAGEFVSSIATDQSNLNSSEFSLSMKADQPQVVVTPTSGLITTEAGGTASFTVVLAAKPTATVTIPISISNPAEGKVSVTTLTFTTANWSKAQTIVVTGLDDLVADGDQAYTIVIGKATSTDTNYNGIDGDDVSVVNMDDEVAGIQVTPTSGLITSEAGGTASFSVVLTSQPVGTVTIAVASNNLAEGTVSVSSLTFTAANWNVPQTIVVTGVDDFWDDGNVAYSIILSPAVSTGTPYDGVDPTDASVTNTDNDTAGFVVNPTSGLITTEAGGQATFTVRLTSQPTANVVINVTSSNTSEGTISVTSLTFTAANWNVDQIVTITGVNDFVDDGDIGYSIVLAPAVSADGVYNGLNPADVAVTNTDNDSAGFVVNPTSGLITTEAGGQATFTVRLTSQPTANVVINVSSTNVAEGTVSVTSLTFTAANWNVDQVVTITGIDELIADGHQNYTIVLDPASSGDGNYNGLNPADVSATNQDNDAAGVTVTPLTGLITTEAGGQAKFSVTLTSQPTANVVINLSVTDPTEGFLSVSSLTFTAGNWNVPQVVTITGLDDFVVDGSVSNVVLLQPATSSDPVYNGIDAADVSVVNLDDDVAEIKVTPTSGLVTTENGGTASFTVVLTSQPTGDVTITLASSDTSEGSLSTTTLIFTVANWKVAQTVVVTGVDDLIVDGLQSYSVILNPATSSDKNYNGVDPANVNVSNVDNDSAGIIVTPTSGLITSEAGGQANFTVRLASQPTANVTINIASSNLGEGTVSVTSLTFTAANWNFDQTVTVTGVNDFIDDGDVNYTVDLSPATSSDGQYNGLDATDVSATNIDDDTAGIIVTPTIGLATTEAGGQATFSVRLTSQPLSPVTITLVSSNAGEGSPSTTLLTFTSANWNVDQIVTITGVDDFIDDGDVGYTILLSPAVSADASFAGQDPTDVSATNVDDDSAGIVVTPASGLVTTEAGGQATFSVRLTSQPIAPVTINISSGNVAESTVNVVAVTFTAANWNIDQIVTVTGNDDFVDDGDVGYTIILSSATSGDANYSGRDAADVGVTNLDDDTAGIVVTPTTGLVTTEAGGQATVAVRLTSQPLSPVTIAIASANSAEGVASVTSLTFTAANWNVEQVVTVTGVDDFIDDGDVFYTIVVGPATSGDAIYNAKDANDVSASNSDDDTAGIVVMPTNGLVTTEVGGQASFAVRLTSQPVMAVTITVSSTNSAEGTVAVTSLTFTAANWNVYQVVTITGVDDFVDDGDVAFSIIVSPATSGDVNYNNRDGNDVAAINIDDDTVGIVVTPTVGLVTTEAGGQANFTIRLTSQPIAPVTINLVSSHGAEGVISVTSVTFTVANWNIAQAVTITGVDDFSADGNIAYTVFVDPATSSDGLYQGLDGADVAVINNDNDVIGILVAPTGAMVTTEAGGTATFTIRLTSQPSASVVLQMFSTRTGEGVINISSVVFSPADWNVPLSIMVTGIDDFLDDGDQNYAVRFQLSTSADPQYQALPISDVGVVNQNDDFAGFVIIGGPQLSVDESGTTTSIQIVLTSQPIAPVTFVVTSTIPGEVEVMSAFVTFDPTNWSTPQSVTFRGVADGVEDADVSVPMIVGTASFDPLYDRRSDALAVTNRNVVTMGSDSSLATAVTPGVAAPNAREEEFTLDERALVTTSEVLGNSATNSLSLGSGSGGGEGDDANGDDANPNVAGGLLGPVAVDRPGLSPSSQQRFRRAIVTLPPNILAATLPTLRFEPIRESLGKMGRDLQDESGVRTATVRITMGTAAVASAGYVLWSLRGAAWVASAVASSLPTWSAFDPLVLLARRREDEKDGDSLTEMIESAQTV